MLNAFLRELPQNALAAVVAAVLIGLFNVLLGETLKVAVAETVEDIPLWIGFVVVFSLFRAWRARRATRDGAV
jgi:hypothetical protein